MGHVENLVGAGDFPLKVVVEGAFGGLSPITCKFREVTIGGRPRQNII